MKAFPYPVMPQKQVRVIVDTDCACEADDQFALAHHLFSPKSEVTAIHSVHFADRFGANSEQESYEEILHILKLVAPLREPPVFHGAAHAMPEETTPVDSPAVQNLIRHARCEDARPLYVAVQGAATNVASALLLAPDIASRITVVWIGGGTYPEGELEFNVENDLHAANCLLKSSAEVWQVPKNVYSSMVVPFSVLLEQVAPCGALGEYLMARVMKTQQKFVDWIQRPGYTQGAYAASYPSAEAWILGDQPTAGLIAFDQRYRYHMRPAPTILPDGRYAHPPASTRLIRVYESLDGALILDDFYAKLRYHCAEQTAEVSL